MSDNEGLRSPDRKRSFDDEDDFSDPEQRENQNRHKRPALSGLSPVKGLKAEEDGISPSADPSRRPSNPERSTPGSAVEDHKNVLNPPLQLPGTGHGSSTDPSEESAPTLGLRAVVASKEAGVIIGKGGKNVSDIRDRSGARITISEMVVGAVERVLTVTGPLDTVAKAYSLIARKILDEAADRDQDTVRSTSVRILVPNNRMGSIIGKAGSKIKEIQEASGARLIASEDMLPGSTERTITVSGVPDSIHIAAYHIGLILQDHPERSAGTALYKPTARLSGGYAAPIDPYGGGFNPHYPSPHAPYQNAPRNPPPGSQAQQIFIPNDMVGCIIGKGGTKINEIRQLSGSNIKIAEPHGNTNERLVTITGTPESNQMALYLLYSRLESEKGRLAGGH